MYLSRTFVKDAGIDCWKRVRSMIVCLFGMTCRDDHDVEAERELAAMLYQQHRTIPGYLEQSLDARSRFV